MQITLKENFGDVLRKLDQLQADVAQRALASAINKTMDQAQTEVVREITREFNVGREYVKKRLRITRASFKTGVFTMRAELRAGDGKGRSANLIVFAEKNVSLAEGRRRAKAGTQGQVFFQIKRAGGKKTKPGVFIGNKGRTVFERVTGTTMASRSRYAGTKHAQQITAVQTIDVPQMFNTRRINTAVVRKMLTKFPEIFDREAKFYTTRFSAR